MYIPLLQKLHVETVCKDDSCVHPKVKTAKIKKVKLMLVL